MIGILSDSHDNLDALEKAIRFFQDAGCALLIHAGDFVAPFSARVLNRSGRGPRRFSATATVKKKG